MEQDTKFEQIAEKLTEIQVATARIEQDLKEYYASRQI